MSPNYADTGPFSGSRVAALAAAVLLWRAAAFAWPSSLITTADSLRLPLTLLGVLFLVYGVVPVALALALASGRRPDA